MPESTGITVPLSPATGPAHAEAAAGNGAAAEGGEGTPAQDHPTTATSATTIPASPPAPLASATAPDRHSHESAAKMAKRSARMRLYRENVRYIPMRLSDIERQYLAVIEGAMRISEYTDKVDVSRYGTRVDIMAEEIAHICEYMIGNFCCVDLKKTIKIVSRNLSDNALLLQRIVEVGRRYKIMNPDKMRSTYGKLMYMLQDTRKPAVLKQTEMQLVAPILTVESFLQERGVPQLTSDPRFLEATQDTTLIDDREEAQLVIRAKAEAQQALIQSYAGERLSADDIVRVINSVADSNNYQAAASAPVIRMLEFLETFFQPNETRDDFGDLSIRGGDREGSKLTHSHSEQYTYVRQTLMLWKEITERMFQLWYAADHDLLAEDSRYELYNTGQGLNRVQSCPAVARLMHDILRSVQTGRWVGLSVVHLGDRDVPNALIFIDKYTQVPRILTPILHTLDRIEALAEDPNAKPLIMRFRSVALLRRHILRDFFRLGFNGDGDDGGSCIDGRLTSAWNWCSKLEKKPFYDIFMLAGFQGFDGSFKN